MEKVESVSVTTSLVWVCGICTYAGNAIHLRNCSVCDSTRLAGLAKTLREKAKTITALKERLAKSTATRNRERERLEAKARAAGVRLD